MEEVRFALAINGGVSLAVWIGGVAAELHQLGRAGATPGQLTAYSAACTRLEIRPRVDVVAGASAGGLNGIFLALAQAHDIPDLSALRDLWIRLGSFDELLRPPRDRDPNSLLQGDAFFLPALEAAIGQFLIAPPLPADQWPIDVRLTVTSLTGEQHLRRDTQGHVIVDRDHRVVLHFNRGQRLDDGTIRDDFTAADADERAKLAHRLARAARSTASFPGAFEASWVSIGHPDTDDDLTSYAEGFDRSRFLADGGILVNLPLDPALRAVFAQPATGPVRRVMAIVVPDPSDATDGIAADERSAPPSVTAVVRKSLIDIPANQSVAAYLDEVDGHNRRVETRHRERTVLLQMPVDSIAALGQQLLAVYQAGRRASSVRAIYDGLAASTRTRADLAKLATVEDIDRAVGARPWWVPTDDALDVLRVDCWGAEAIRRMAGVVLDLLDRAETIPAVRGTLGSLNKQVYDAVLRAQQAWPPNDEVWWRAMSAYAPLDTRWLTAALEAFPCPSGTSAADVAAARGVLGQAITTLGDVTEQLLAKVGARTETDPHRNTADVGDIGLRELADNHVRARVARQRAIPDDRVDHEGVRFLLSVEVVQTVFSGFEYEVEQAVELVQISSVDVAPADPLHRTRSDGKIAGIQLGHFGAFLKQSWRANDWLWGRLDGTTHLARVLISRSAIKTLAPDKLLELIAGGPDGDYLREQLDRDMRVADTDLQSGHLKKTGQALAAWVDAPTTASESYRRSDALAASFARRRQLEILREELPVLASALIADEQAGGDPAAAGLALARAVYGPPANTRTKNAAPPVPIAPVGPTTPGPRLAELLGLNLTGTELALDQRSSDLVTQTATRAVAAGTNMLANAEPKSFSSLLKPLRGITQIANALVTGLGPHHSIRRPLFTGLVGVTATAVALDLFAGANLGVLRFPAWLVLLLALLYGCVQFRSKVIIPVIALLVVIPGVLSSIPPPPSNGTRRGGVWSIVPKSWTWLPIPKAWPILGLVAVAILLAVLRETKRRQKARIVKGLTKQLAAALSTNAITLAEIERIASSITQ